MRETSNEQDALKLELINELKQDILMNKQQKRILEAEVINKNMIKKLVKIKFRLNY